jgi:glycine betaine/proline transport system ATP-binding protein
MNGLIRPTAGTVRVDGRAIGSLSARELELLRSSQVGMVFQSTSLFPHRTVIDNVVFGLEVRRIPRPARYKVAREWLERVHLAEWAEHFPAQLSGGMQQRVGLARTFATDPETLLLDEPFSALDPIIRRSLQDQFVLLVRTFRKTAVFVTHDFAEAMRIADRIAVMADGRIMQLGTPRDIVMNPASSYVAKFATPEIRRALLCVADIARPGCGTRALAGDTPLAEAARLLQAEDIRFDVRDAQGRSLGWVDRGVLLGYFGEGLETPDM